MIAAHQVHLGASLDGGAVLELGPERLAQIRRTSTSSTIDQVAALFTCPSRSKSVKRSTHGSRVASTGTSSAGGGPTPCARRGFVVTGVEVRPGEGDRAVPSRRRGAPTARPRRWPPRGAPDRHATLGPAPPDAGAEGGQRQRLPERGVRWNSTTVRRTTQAVSLARPGIRGVVTGHVLAVAGEGVERSRPAGAQVPETDQPRLGEGPTLLRDGEELGGGGLGHAVTLPAPRPRPEPSHEREICRKSVDGPGAPVVRWAPIGVPPDHAGHPREEPFE